MKKSEIYKIAAMCVMDSAYEAEDRLEILKVLLDDKSTAEWVEAQSEKEVLA